MIPFALSRSKGDVVGRRLLPPFDKLRANGNLRICDSLVREGDRLQATRAACLCALARKRPEGHIKPTAPWQ